MSTLKAIKNDLATSLGSMVALDRSEEDMQNLSEAHGKPLKKSGEYIKVAGNPNKIQNLVNDISDILKNDQVKEGQDQKKEKKKAHHIKSKDYLGDKKNRIPSAAELMNNPLRDSYQGLESGGNYGGSYRDFSNLTAKDLSKSVSESLDYTAGGSTKKSHGRKGRHGSLDVKKSSAAIINSTLTSTLELAEPKNTSIKTSLGVTGKDLANATKSSLDDGKEKKDKRKTSKGSIGAALNGPFRQSLEALGLNDDPSQKPKPVQISAPKDTDMISATKEQHRNHAHEKI